MPIMNTYVTRPGNTLQATVFKLCVIEFSSPRMFLNPKFRVPALAMEPSEPQRRSVPRASDIVLQARTLPRVDRPTPKPMQMKRKGAPISRAGGIFFTQEAHLHCLGGGEGVGLGKIRRPLLEPKQRRGIGNY